MERQISETVARGHQLVNVYHSKGKGTKAVQSRQSEEDGVSKELLEQVAEDFIFLFVKGLTALPGLAADSPQQAPLRPPRRVVRAPGFCRSRLAVGVQWLRRSRVETRQ